MFWASQEASGAVLREREGVRSALQRGKQAEVPREGLRRNHGRCPLWLLPSFAKAH